MFLLSISITMGVTFFDEYPLHFSGRAAKTLETYGGFLKWGIPQKP
jgi:hypothetical protein